MLYYTHFKRELFVRLGRASGRAQELRPLSLPLCGGSGWQPCLQKLAASAEKQVLCVREKDFCLRNEEQ